MEFTDVLTEGLGERKFTKLRDGITKRSYVVAEIHMMNSNRFKIIEVERERRPLSTIILSSNFEQNWSSIYNYFLVGLVNASGSWNIVFLMYLTNRLINIANLKITRKNIIYAPNS